ncbi:pseudouridine-5'-phosphate glycosidase [Streptomyces sp. W16]|uniref:pseudouridine-5'-phosphate glycosidase n=1 Tax=Streptomyces sp. W16 TaxID=3076631 RepID=UPI00295A95CF|nr:pseudouridine-5'-phosphate glycosidase [Streptomyces sp. W16]MDV9171081.1 pseudouridine-5'-phosphate glycosidase [Streptomyces sp. W16]
MTARIPIVHSEEVHEALHEGRPVVALESNVITHGLKYPQNAETAYEVEAAVRKGGSVPATICVEDGAIRVGMTEQDIERFASGTGIPKVSSRDLPVVLARRGPGATTVASSLVAAELAGIPFFASAGLGGVHRGAGTTMDISSDLIQLTRSKVAVVCAGAKMILDLKLTMEYLETQCVPVISHGSDDFPAFYCASSGVRSPHRIDDEDLIAEVVATHWATGHAGGIVLTTPPRAEDAVDAAEAEAAIRDALAQAERDGVTGQGLTKYLMHAVDRATGGRTAQANMAVLISTAEVGGRLAAAYARHVADGS